MTWYQIIYRLLCSLLYNIKRCILSESVRIYFKHVSGMFMYMIAVVIGASLGSIVMQSVLVP